MVDKALPVRGSLWDSTSTLFLSWGLYKSSSMETVLLLPYAYTYIPTHSCICVCSLKKKKTSPHFWPAPDHFLWSRHEGEAETGSGVARGLAFQLQEPPPSSYSSSPSCLPHYSGKNGGLCSSHQLIPVECSRHGTHHGGQLTTNPLFIELAVDMGMWNTGHCGKCQQREPKWNVQGILGPSCMDHVCWVWGWKKELVQRRASRVLSH